MTNQHEAHDDWEYEYDQNEIEVFLVDLDLTTANRNFRASTANRQKRLLDVNSKPAAKKQKISQNGKKAQATAADTSNASLGDEARNQARNSTAAESRHAAESSSAKEDSQAPASGVQILDLHGGNPIVSYKGQVFSCAWTDTIGTTMFFGKPRETALFDPDLSTDDFDLIGMSRIKLVGREAKVTPIAQNQNQSQSQSQGAPQGGTAPPPPERPGQSLGTIKRTNAKLNADLRKQANFLEQLMNIKKNRGEQDNVHVVMNNQIAKSVADGHLRLNTQQRRQQIDELNRKVVTGDAEALRKLEQIYSGQDLEESDDDADHPRSEAAHKPDISHWQSQAESDAGYEEEKAERPRIIGTASPSSGSSSPRPNIPINTEAALKSSQQS